MLAVKHGRGGYQQEFILRTLTHLNACGWSFSQIDAASQRIFYYFDRANRGAFGQPERCRSGRRRRASVSQDARLVAQLGQWLHQLSRNSQSLHCAACHVNGTTGPGKFAQIRFPGSIRCATVVYQGPDCLAVRLGTCL